MAEMEKLLKNIVLGSIGAVSTAVDKADDLAKSLVAKGEETVKNNRPAMEELARSMVEKGEETVKAGQPVMDELRTRLKEAADAAQYVKIDVEKLSREARDELRRQLDHLDELENRVQTEEAEDDASVNEQETAEEKADSGSEENG